MRYQALKWLYQQLRQRYDGWPGRLRVSIDDGVNVTCYGADGELQLLMFARLAVGHEHAIRVVSYDTRRDSPEMRESRLVDLRQPGSLELLVGLFGDMFDGSLRELEQKKSSLL